MVTVAFMANAIRTYFGDGSEFGVRMVYATESTPLGHGRLGAGTPATSSTSGSWSSPGTSSPTSTCAQVVSSTTGTGRPRHPGPQGGRQPARVRDRHHPATTDRSSGSSKSPPGARSSATPSTPGSTCSSRRSSTSSPRASPVDFSGESFPAALAAGERLFGYVADGYWEDVGTLEAYLKSHQDILDQRVQVDIEGFQLRPGVWSARVRRSTRASSWAVLR